MDKKFDLNNWLKWNYQGGCQLEEYCHDRSCGWRRPMEKDISCEELEVCPVCGDVTCVSITFGGGEIHYNRLKDNFTLREGRGPDTPCVYIDNADCPNAIVFMMRHFQFNG